MNQFTNPYVQQPRQSPYYVQPTNNGINWVQGIEGAKAWQLTPNSSTIKNAIKTGLIKWVSWEKETKILYERMYKELMDIGEVASAIKIKELICDVDSELKEAEQFYLNKEAIGYDLVSIVEEQKPCHKKYKSKLRKCFNGKGNKV